MGHVSGQTGHSFFMQFDFDYKPMHRTFFILVMDMGAV